MTTLLVIASESGGRLIGNRGDRIKGIRQSSGASISLSETNMENTQTVTITGSKNERLLASNMVKQIVGASLRSEKTDVMPQGPIRLLQRPRKSTPSAKTIVGDKRGSLAVPIVKDLYMEHYPVSVMSAEEVNEFRLRNNNILVSYGHGSDVSQPIPKPITTFEDAFYSHPKLLHKIKKQGLTQPFPVQAQAWPIILSGFNLTVNSNLLTGKTLAYALPAIIHCLGQPTPLKNRVGPSVLILVPTTISALHVRDEIQKYLLDGISVVCVNGYIPITIKSPDLINKRPEILVCTPERLNELVAKKIVKLDHVSYLVLDEPGCILSLGYKKEIKLFLKQGHPDKQIILASSESPESIQGLAKSYDINSLHLTVNKSDVFPTVSQKVFVLEDHEKEDWLEQFLIDSDFTDDRILIFLHERMSVEEQLKNINDLNIKWGCIHGGQSQLEQEATLTEMRNGQITILVATDVESQSLDIPCINVIINYNFPLDVEEYVHRVNMIKKTGKRGKIFTFFSYEDAPNVYDFIGVLNNTKQEITEEVLKIVFK